MNKINIIPSPKKIIISEDCASVICTGISFCDEAFAGCFDAFSDIVKKVWSIDLSASCGGIFLYLDTSLDEEEYRITVDSDGAKLYASCKAGIMVALSTLLQICEEDGEKLRIPMCEINDQPDCKYRTLMVDLGRQWHPFETLLKYVDLCFIYRVRFLHLHFIDSIIYTLPSKKFPKMPTEGKHYSFEEIALLNEYAEKMGIEIIPEMEVPGHSRPMVTAYPELFADTPDSCESVEDYALFFANMKNNLICAGKPGIIDTVRELALEIISMFPNSRYLHIGGDEAAIGEWANCRDCKAYMKENSIDGVKPLYTDFIRRVTDAVIEMGKTPIVWEGFPKEGSETISKKVIVTAWESYYQLAPELIDGGFNITNSSWEPLYTIPKGAKAYLPEGRWSPEEVLDWNIYTWKNWNKKTAAYERPIVIEPTDKVLGATFCVWENNYDNEIEAVRENLAAMSEKVWNINSPMTHEELRACLDKMVPIAKKLT